MSGDDGYARELMARIKQGGVITEHERSRLRAIVTSRSGDLHNAMRALAASSPFDGADCREMLEILNTTDDDWAAQGAIYALFSYWRIDSSHLRSLDRFVDPDAWEAWPSAAIAGIGALGDYAHRSDDMRHLAKLVQIAEEDDVIRKECAVAAVEVAINGPTAVRDRVLRGPAPGFDAALMQQARARLADFKRKRRPVGAAFRCQDKGSITTAVPRSGGRSGRSSCARQTRSWPRSRC